MIEARGISRYQETDASSVGPEKLIVMLYEKLLDHINRAAEDCENGNVRRANNNVNSAQDIVVELRNALDHSFDSDISINLQSLYDFIFQENISFIIDHDAKHLANVHLVLEPLLHAWRQIPPGSAEQARRDLDPVSQVEPVPEGLETERNLLSLMA